MSLHLSVPELLQSKYAKTLNGKECIPVLSRAGFPDSSDSDLDLNKGLGVDFVEYGPNVEARQSRCLTCVFLAFKRAEVDGLQSSLAISSSGINIVINSTRMSRYIHPDSMRFSCVCTVRHLRLCAHQAMGRSLWYDPGHRAGMIGETGVNAICSDKPRRLSRAGVPQRRRAIAAPAPRSGLTCHGRCHGHWKRARESQ